MLQVQSDRALLSADRKAQGLPCLNKITPEEERQLALYNLRHVLFDSQGNVHVQLRHSIQKFYKHCGISLALDGSDSTQCRVKLQDKSLLRAPLPDLPPFAHPEPSATPLQPDAGELVLQAKKDVRKGVICGKADRADALADTTRRSRGAVYDPRVVSEVLQGTSVPMFEAEEGKVPQAKMASPEVQAPKKRQRGSHTLASQVPAQKGKKQKPAGSAEHDDGTAAGFAPRAAPRRHTPTDPRWATLLQAHS